MSSTSDILGFYKDPKTGRYFAIPENPASYVTNFPIRNDENNTVFNNIPLSILEKTSRKSIYGLPNIISSYQKGLVNKQDYSSHIVKLHLSRLRKNYLYPFVFSGNCRYIVQDDLSFVGVWHQGGFMSLSEINISKHDEPVSVYENTLNRYYGYTITHLNLFHIFGCTYIIKCAVSSLSSQSTLKIFPKSSEDRLNFGFSAQSKKHTYRYCNVHPEMGIIAIGMNGGLDLLNFSDSSTISSVIPPNVAASFSKHDQRSGEFLSCGNVLFSAAAIGTLNAYDIRMPRVLKIAHLGRGIEYMKILSNDNTLITSGYDNKLSSIDIRMNKVVFDYPGHYNKHRKLLFTYNEFYDVLCCTGQDNETRFWSLKQGKPLASLKSPLETENQVYSVFCPQNDALSTILFYDNRMMWLRPVFEKTVD